LPVPLMVMRVIISMNIPPVVAQKMVLIPGLLVTLAIEVSTFTAQM